MLWMVLKSRKGRGASRWNSLWWSLKYRWAIFFGLSYDKYLFIDTYKHASQSNLPNYIYIVNLIYIMYVYRWWYTKVRIYTICFVNIWYKCTMNNIGRGAWHVFLYELYGLQAPQGTSRRHIDTLKQKHVTK